MEESMMDRKRRHLLSEDKTTLRSRRPTTALYEGGQGRNREKGKEVGLGPMCPDQAAQTYGSVVS